MSDPVLRQASAADLPVLEGFEQGVVGAERPYDATLRDTGVRYYDLPALVASPEVRFLIAAVDGTPVGCGFARIDAAKPYARHARQGYLGLMYVVPAHRGRGLNRLILEDLSRWCLGQGIAELRLDVYPGNEAALRAYAKVGFQPHLLEMRLDLTPSGRGAR